MELNKLWRELFSRESDKKAYFGFFGSGLILLFAGSWIALISGDNFKLISIPYIGFGALFIALGLDFRISRLEKGMDKIRERVK